MARAAGYLSVISHRSRRDGRHVHRRSRGGDRRGPDQDRLGASRTDRVAKYNQLLRIEEQLGGAAEFPGGALYGHVGPRGSSKKSGGGRGLKRLLVAAGVLAALAFAVEGGEYGTRDLMRQKQRSARLALAIDSAAARRGLAQALQERGSRPIRRCRSASRARCSGWCAATRNCCIGLRIRRRSEWVNA